MIKCEEKIESRKEYTTPQMEIVDCAVQSFLCQSTAPGGGDIECVGSNCP